MKSSNNIIKLLTLLFAVVLFAGFISLPLHLRAASDVQLKVSDASGKAGDDVIVLITISPNSGLSAAGMYLKYDADKLTYQNHSNGPASGMTSVNPNFRTQDNFKIMKFALISSPGITVGGTMYSITFNVKPSWTGATTLILTTDEFIDGEKYELIPHEISNGSITIGTPTTTVATTATATGTSTTKPGETTTTKPGVTTTTRPTTTRTQLVTDKDGANVTETDKAGSTVNKTTVIYETVARTEFVTEKDGSKVTEKDAAGSTVYKTTVVYEKVVGTEYVTGEDGSKVFATDESGSTVYATSLVYETVDSEDIQGETGTENTSDNGVMGALSTAKKTALIIAFVCVFLVAAVLVAYKRKKDAVK